ncbi:MAG: NF038122 family metalloprotease [Thiohalocapsa sp.]
MTIHPPASNPGLSNPAQLPDNLTFDFSPPNPAGPLGHEPGLWLADDTSGGQAVNLLSSDADPFGSGSGAKLSYLIGHRSPDSITLPQTASSTESGVSFSLPSVTPPPFATSDNLGFDRFGADAPGLDFLGESKSGGGGSIGGHGGGGGGGSLPLTVTYGTGGALQFQVTYDSSVTGARNASTIENAFAVAVGYFTDNFTTPLGGATASNPVTVNLNVGWGEVDNSALPSGALGASFTNLETVNYSDFAPVLNQKGVVSSVPYDTALPGNGDPLFATPHNYVIATAEAKAIGLGTPSATDGWVGFSSSAQWYFGSGKPTKLTQYDFIGVAEHEISEALGRISQLGTTAPLNGDITGGSTAANAYTPFDLFRFDPNTNARSLTGGEAAKYSFDDMTTLGTSFNSGAGDYGDWAVPAAGAISTTSPNDAYDAGSYSGVQYAALHNDTTVVAGLGYGPLTSTSPVLA